MQKNKTYFLITAIPTQKVSPLPKKRDWGKKSFTTKYWERLVKQY